MAGQWEALQAEVQARQQQQQAAINAPPAVRPFQEPDGKPADRPAPANPNWAQDAATAGVQQGQAAVDPIGAAANEAVTRTLPGLGAGIMRAPGQLLGGLLDTGADAGKFVDDNISSEFMRVPAKLALGLNPVGLLMGGPGTIFAGQAARNSNGGASLADTLSMRQSLGQVGDPAINQFATEALPVAAAFLGQEEGAAPALSRAGARVLNGAAKVLTDSAKVGVVTAVTADPRSQRVANMIQQAGVHGAFIDFLASNPSDPDILNRFRAGLEGAGMNAALQPLFMGFGKLMQAVAGRDAAAAQTAARDLHARLPQVTVETATPHEAVADSLDRAFASGRTQEARNVANEQAAAIAADGGATTAGDSGGAPAGPESAGAGTRHTDVAAGAGDGAAVPGGTEGGAAPPNPSPDTRPPGDGGPNADGGGGRTPPVGDAGAAPAGGEGAPAAAQPEHPLTTLAADANAALRKSGSPEQLTPDRMGITTDGKILVSPVSADAAQDAGFGRVFQANPNHGATWGDDPDNYIDHLGMKRNYRDGQPAGPPVRIFKVTSPDGSQRIVGMMDQDDLDGFLNDAKAWRENHDASAARIDQGTAPGVAARVGQWSIGKLGASYDVPYFMRALAGLLEGTVRPLPDAELHGMAKIIADQTGLHADDVLNLGHQYAGNTRDLAVGMQALRTVQTRLMQDVMNLRGIDFRPMPEDSPTVQYALSRIKNMMDFAASVVESKTGIAQAMRSMSLPDTDSYLESAAQRARPDAPPLEEKAPEQLPIPRNAQELHEYLQQMDALGTTGDPTAVMNYLMGKLTVPEKWAYLGTSLANAFTANIVSAPRTLIRDIWGPAIISGINTMGRTGAGAMVALNPFIDAGARREAWVASWGAARAYATTLSDVADALRTAAKTTAGAFTRPSRAVDPYWDPFGSNIGTTHPMIGGHGPIDLDAQGVPRILINAALGRGGAGVTGAVPYYLGNLLNKFPQAVFGLHGGFNEFAQSLAYAGEVRAAAYNEAGKLGLQGADFKQYLQDRLSNMRDNATGEATDPDAFNQAQRTTLVRRVDLTPQSRDPAAMQAMFKMRRDIIQTIPAARFIMPIFTVPANALGESLRRIPGLGFIRDMPGLGQGMVESADALAGRNGVPAMVDAYGRQLMGGGVLLAGAALGQAGLLTGAGPDNAEDREAWLGRSGSSAVHEPYSIRVGDHWYSYAKSDVVGPLLSIMAAFNDRTVYAPSTQDFGQHALAAAAGLAEYFKDQAALQGMAQVLNFGGDPQESGSILTRVLGQVGAGMIPGSGIFRQIRDETDPLQRQHHTVGDYILDSIPGLSHEVDPVRNVLGEPVMKPRAPGFGTLPVSMANVATHVNEPVLNELSRLYETTGEAHGVMSPSLGPNTNGANMTQLRLEDGRSLYDHLMQARMSAANENGDTLRTALTNLIQSPEYQQALDGRSTQRTDDQGTPYKGAMVTDLFNQAARAARQQVAQQSPMGARFLATAHAMNANPVATHGYTVPQLAGSDHLLGSLGINIQDYESTARGQ